MSKLYYKNDTIFLYVKFLDEHNKPVQIVNNAQVRILHQENNNIYEDLEWTNLYQLSTNEFFLNYTIPNDSTNGLYDVIYKGEVNNKLIQIVESFYVIEKLPQYDGVIKIYGYVNQNKSGIPLANVDIQIIHKDNLYNSQSYTKDNGYWECFVYPGQYTFTFNKETFISESIITDIGPQDMEIQFNNISLCSLNKTLDGNGIYEIKDKYILKDGIPLDGLNVSISDIFNPTEKLVDIKTNNKGEWIAYLDPGNYLLKVSGNSMNMDFNKTMRLKVNDDSSFSFDDISNNIANITTNTLIDSGSGSNVVSDIILDNKNNPIPEVQITAYNISTPNIPIAEAYTDITGKYELFLNPGSYLLYITHPAFKNIPPQKITV